MTSCYFPTNVGRHNTTGRAKQHSVSQTAECIHAEMNSQFQSGLKIKSVRKNYVQVLLPFTPALLLPFARVISPDLDSGNSQNEVIFLFLFYPSKTSPNCCKTGVSELFPSNLPINSFLWCSSSVFCFLHEDLTCSNNVLQIMIMVNVGCFHCWITHFSHPPFFFGVLCLSSLLLRVHTLLWKRRGG